MQDDVDKKLIRLVMFIKDLTLYPTIYKEHEDIDNIAC